LLISLEMFNYDTRLHRSTCRKIYVYVRVSHIARWSLLGHRIPSTAAPNNGASPAVRSLYSSMRRRKRDYIAAGAEARQHQDLEVARQTSAE